jgi:hypothetical protein
MGLFYAAKFQTVVFFFNGIYEGKETAPLIL